jgi:dUTP pyrophosphatase
MKLRYHKFKPEATAPTKKHLTDAGWDLYAAHTVELQPRQRFRVGTGLAIWFEPTRIQANLIEQAELSWYGRLAEKSGLAANHGLMVIGGVVDRHFRGEVEVVLYNSGDEVISIQPGHAICQIVPTMIFDVRGLEHSDTVPATDRGTTGFGSVIE